MSLDDTTVPLILPVKRGNKNVADCYTLHYPNKVIIYYAYQNPIAFLSDVTFFTRLTYWRRRQRAKRKSHTNNIQQHAASTVQIRSSGEKRITIIRYPTDKEFFASLEEKLGIITPSATIPTAVTINPITKRRKLLI